MIVAETIEVYFIDTVLDETDIVLVEPDHAGVVPEFTTKLEPEMYRLRVMMAVGPMNGSRLRRDIRE